MTGKTEQPGKCIQPRLFGDRQRIVHVALGMDIGGMERLLGEFARCADRQRFQLSFVSLQSPGKIAAELASCGWSVHTLDKMPGLRPRVVARLARLLRQERADVVHTHNAAGYLYGVSAAILARVPHVVHTRHGRGGSASSRQRRAFRLYSRFVDCIVCVSEDARQVSIHEGIPPNKLRTVRNGIDVNRFPYSGPVRGGPAVVVARLSPEKDIATLLQAVALVVRRIAGFRLQIVGDGSCRQQLQALTAQLKLAESVDFLGEQQDVSAILARSSLFVLPSLTEGISLALLEAMACGLPVVATRVGGNCEVIIDGQTGLLVPPGDPAALADAIGSVYIDPGRARRIAASGRRRVEQTFTAQRMIRQYEQIYTRLCRGQELADPPVGEDHRAAS